MKLAEILMPPYKPFKTFLDRDGSTIICSDKKVISLFNGIPIGAYIDISSISKNEKDESYIIYKYYVDQIEGIMQSTVLGCLTEKEMILLREMTKTDWLFKTSTATNPSTVFVELKPITKDYVEFQIKLDSKGSNVAVVGIGGSNIMPQYYSDFFYKAGYTVKKRHELDMIREVINNRNIIGMEELIFELSTNDVADFATYELTNKYYYSILSSSERGFSSFIRADQRIWETEYRYYSHKLVEMGIVDD